MAVTIKEVARRAGVSVATVSRVFNDSGPVSEATRRRIHAVAKRLRYTPNSAARSLITSRTSAVGVLLPDLYGEFFSEVIRGIDRTAQRRGYHLLVSGWHNDRKAIEAMLRSMRGRVDGLIVMSPHLDAPALTANLPENLPAVLLNCPVEGDAFDALNIDNFGGAYEMVRHLVGHGHARVALIKGVEENHDARERQRGYRAALRDGGAEWSEALELTGDFTESAGHRAAREALALVPRPTALFAANDSMAIGALSALREAGLRVPADVAVAGFDDIPISGYTTPPLTSVHVSIDELGGRACERLIEAVHEKNTHERRQELLPTRLVIRGTCGCAGAESRILGSGL